jgi:D-beta-D-heptose 7-phosphate kinase/D-beta-D-heptose 1-phosphate adenosyltransferase
MSDAILLDIPPRSSGPVLVPGDVMLDPFVRVSSSPSPEAPVPVMALERTATCPAAPPASPGNAVALGAQVVLIGVVGAR